MLYKDNKAVMLMPFHEREVMPIKMNFNYIKMQRLRDYQINNNLYSKAGFPEQSDTIEVDILQ